jgi:hypothetical protein
MKTDANFKALVCCAVGAATLLLAMVLAITTTSCTPTPTPVVPSPDASDASALGDSTPVPPTPAPTVNVDPVCTTACGTMIAIGCVQDPGPSDPVTNCATVLTLVEQHRLKIDPSITVAGADNTLQCKALVGVTSAAQVQAHGWSCGPPVAATKR